MTTHATIRIEGIDEILSSLAEINARLERLEGQPDELIDVKELAKIQRVSEDTVRRWAREGKIETVRQGKKMLFRRSVIEGVKT